MADAGESYFREELGRRTLEINDLHQDLACARDRVLDAEDRTLELQQKISKLEAEIAIRKVKGMELENRVAREQAEGAGARQRFVAAEGAHAAEVTRSRLEIDQAHSVQARAEATAEAALSHADGLEGEARTLRARIEALRRDSEQQREDFAREQAAEEGRQAQLMALEQQKGTEQVREAKASLIAIASEVSSAQNEVLRLEAALAMEAECSKGVEVALQRTLEHQKVASKHCEILKREVEARKTKDTEGDLRKALERCKCKCQQLTQEVASTKREGLMQTQTIQGAIEETRRMLADHLDQTARHVEETQRCPEASPLADLVAMLFEARGRAAQIVEKKMQRETEKGRMELEVRQDEEALSIEKERAAQHRLHMVERDLSKRRQDLESSSHFAGSAQEAMRRVEDSVAEAERSVGLREAQLRGKLEELWRALRQAQASRGYH